MVKKHGQMILVATELGTRTADVPEDIRKQFPAESEGLGAWGNSSELVGVTRGVNDRWAHLVEGFTVTHDELAILAQHYFDEASALEFFCEQYQVSGSYEMRRISFAWRRLKTISEWLGDEDLEKTISSLQEKWQRRFEELDALPYCDECQTKHEPDKCLDGVPPCEDCGVVHHRPYMVCPHEA